MKYVTLEEAGQLVQGVVGLTHELSEEELKRRFAAIGYFELQREELSQLMDSARQSEPTKQRIVDAYAPLVFGISKKYLGYGLSLAELMEAGRGGVERALEQFEPEKGYKLGSYAAWWIRHALEQAVTSAREPRPLPPEAHEDSE